MNDPNNPCIFCKINQKELIFENDYAYASSDSYPVSQLHSLVAVSYTHLTLPTIALV